MASGHEAIAFPILEEIGKEIGQRNLEDWEAPDMLAHPLVLLLRCLNKLDSSPEERQKVYSRICRLDPIQALSVSEVAHGSQVRALGNTFRLDRLIDQEPEAHYGSAA